MIACLQKYLKKMIGGMSAFTFGEKISDFRFKNGDADNVGPPIY